MKRTRENTDINITNTAKCLMLLSEGNTENREFECKTCNRKFPSFQALGGHRASHKKQKLMGEGYLHEQSLSLKRKTHECSICGSAFPIGQALGGHMRRHRAYVAKSSSPSSSVTKSSSPPPSALSQTQVIKRTNSRRVLCLDLNLAPYENDLEFSLGNYFQEKMASRPTFHCFI